MAKVDFRYIFISGVLLLSALVGLPRSLSIGAISGLAFLTTSVVLLGSLALLVYFSIPSQVLRLTWPITILIAESIMSIVIVGYNLAAFQNIAVWVGFLIITWTCAHLVTLSGKYDSIINRTIIVLTPIIVVYAGYTVFREEQDPAFPLFGMIMLCYYVARFKYRGELKILLLILVLIAVPFLASARTPAIIGLMIVILAEFYFREKIKWGRVIVGGALLVGLSIAAVTYLEAFRYAFVGGDNALTIAGISLNTSGRAFIWAQTFSSFMESPWFGNGLGSAFELVRSISTQEHPHNDYLRLLHDLGIVGFVTWMIFAVKSARVALRGIRHHRKINQNHRKYYPAGMWHLTALLSIMAVSLSMITDNTIIYSFVMHPLGVFLGSSIGYAIKEDILERGESVIGDRI